MSPWSRRRWASPSSSSGRPSFRRRSRLEGGVHKSLALLPKSKDLRIAVYLTRAAVRTDGLAGLADGLEVLAGFVEKYWDGVHPQLDPDDERSDAAGEHIGQPVRRAGTC